MFAGVYCFVAFKIFIFMAGIVESLTCSRTLSAVNFRRLVSCFYIFYDKCISNMEEN